MIRLFLIRHGETAWNVLGKYQGQSDVALSENGIEQAERLAANFPADTLDRVYTSDLIRAAETAQMVAGRFGIPVKKCRDFREIDFGDWEGRTYKEIASRWPEAMANFFRHPDILKIPNGETFQELQIRAMKALTHILSDKENEEKNVAVFAHGAIIRTMLAGVLGMPLANLWRIRQSNTAVNSIRCDDGFPMIELLNSTCHLERKSSH